VSSASDFFGLAPMDFRHAAPKMLRLLLRRQFARQFPDLGGHTAALCFLRIIELLSLARGLSHNADKLSDFFAQRKREKIQGLSGQFFFQAQNIRRLSEIVPLASAAGACGRMMRNGVASELCWSLGKYPRGLRRDSEHGMVSRNKEPQEKGKMREKDKFTIERASKKKPLPLETLTGISWNQLVSAISNNGIFVAKRIRYANGSFTGATREIDGSDMLDLWQEVERKKQAAK
jgi:hypothetical protein